MSVNKGLLPCMGDRSNQPDALRDAPLRSCEAPIALLGVFSRSQRVIDWSLRLLFLTVSLFRGGKKHASPDSHHGAAHLIQDCAQRSSHKCVDDASVQGTQTLTSLAHNAFGRADQRSQRTKRTARSPLAPRRSFWAWWRKSEKAQWWWRRRACDRHLAKCFVEITRHQSLVHGGDATFASARGVARSCCAK